MLERSTALPVEPINAVELLVGYGAEDDNGTVNEEIGKPVPPDGEICVVSTVCTEEVTGVRESVDTFNPVVAEIVTLEGPVPNVAVSIAEDEFEKVYEVGLVEVIVLVITVTLSAVSLLDMGPEAVELSGI